MKKGISIRNLMVASCLLVALLASTANALEFDSFQAGESNGITTTLHIKIKNGQPGQLVHIVWEKPPGNIVAGLMINLDEDGSLDYDWDIDIAALAGETDKLTLNDAGGPKDDDFGKWVSGGSTVRIAWSVVQLSSFTATGYADHVEVEWTTATEIDNAGFNLHRGLSKEGPYAQLNKALIPAQGDELQGASYAFTDYDVTNGFTYHYWLEDVDLHGGITFHGPVSAAPTSVEDRDEAPIPTIFSLAQNYPNPFNATTAISYQLSGVSPHHTTLKVYNIAGQKVRTLVDEEQAPGYYSVSWDGRDGLGTEVSSGIYFYRLQAGSYAEIRKMVLLK